MYWRAAASGCCDGVVEGDSETTYGKQGLVQLVLKPNTTAV